MVISPQQLADRNKGIGSSDAAAILGLSSYKTPYDIWLQKTGRVEGGGAGEAAWIGTMLEKAVLDMAAVKIGKPVVAAPDHSDATFVDGILRANVDGMVEAFERGRPIVESKTTGQLQDWGDSETDGVPDHVLVQVTHQMICAGSDLCYVARLGAAFGLSFDIFTVPLDRAFAEEIKSRLGEWWDTHVVKDTPPEIVDGQVPSFDLLRARKRDDGLIAELPEELVMNERAAKQRLDAAEQDYANAKALLVAALGDAPVGIGGGLRITVSQVNRNGFDTDKWKLENPELAKRYAKTTSYSKIDIRDVGRVIRSR